MSAVLVTSISQHRLQIRSLQCATGHRKITCRASSEQDSHLHLSYNTSWDNPVVHYSLCGDSWTSQPLQRQVISAGHFWTQLHFPSDHIATQAPSSDSSLLEFVLTDGQGAWDKAPGDQNYVVAAPGKYRLQHGRLQSVTTPRVLIVSDLDDTMVGDDEATAQFAEWWRTTGACAGGRLIYNTGRALDLFEQLLEEKAHCLPEPDMLISGVGTKIYSKELNGNWSEDSAYVQRLNQGWNLEAVREAAYMALATVGKDSMHFRPPSEMNDHKITCGVAYGVLETVLQSLESKLGAERVSYQAIVSGKGDWRFVDLVPQAAGKLNALEYARESLGFEPQETVACGDSGNDRDMLEGRHHAVIVANAQEDLMKWARTAQGPLITQGTRAHGILEGLQRLGFRE